jgi:hypothetical protein
MITEHIDILNKFRKTENDLEKRDLFKTLVEICRLF